MLNKLVKCECFLLGTKVLQNNGLKFDYFKIYVFHLACNLYLMFYSIYFHHVLLHLSVHRTI